MAEKKTAETTATVHSKAQLLASQKYAGRQDVLNVLLDENKTYTTEQVDKLIDKFMKGAVR